LGDVQCLTLMSDCLHHEDPLVCSLAEQAIRDDASLHPLADRLEELGEDASRLMGLMPPRPVVDIYADDEIPF
jgi:hypothetical protein